MRHVSVSDAEASIAEHQQIAAKDEIVLTRDGEVVGLLVGFASDHDWAHYLVEHDPRFARRIAEARQSLRTGSWLRLEDVD